MRLKEALKDNSVLDFTHEYNTNNKLAFLDVMMGISNNNEFIRSVHTKPTKTPDCIRFECDAPLKYKSGVLHTLLNRAWKICSSREYFIEETDRIKKLLINNGFPNSMCDQTTKKFIDRKTANNNYDNDPDNNTTLAQGAEQQSSTRQREARNNESTTSVKLFYRSQYHGNYKFDETAIRKILNRHVFEISVKLDLSIYYKSKKVSDLIKKNNLSSVKLPDGERSHIIYEFRCNEGGCQPLNNTYIGMTHCTLKERLTGHRYQGSIFEHFRLAHSQSPNVNNLLKQTKILYSPDDQRYLAIFEALHIKKLKPTLNRDYDFRCLKLNIT